MQNVTDEIYRMILNNLHITYDPDQSTEERLINEAEAGIAYIKKYCDPDADCSPGTKFGRLLCDYVLRAEAGALETFANDFEEDIIGAKIASDTEQYAEAMGYA